MFSQENQASDYNRVFSEDYDCYDLDDYDLDDDIDNDVVVEEEYVCDDAGKEDEKQEKKEKKRNYKRNSDEFLCNVKTSDENILLVMLSGCPPTRKSYKCPHQCLCKNQLGNVGSAVSKVTNLRRLYYPKHGTTKQRSVKLFQELEKMVRRSTDGTEFIEFVIDGIKVCKGFYRIASGAS